MAASIKNFIDTNNAGCIFTYCEQRVEDEIIFEDIYNGYLYYHFYWYPYKERKAKLQYLPWAKGLHGNAPGGTPYGFYRIQLPNGERVRIYRCA